MRYVLALTAAMLLFSIGNAQVRINLNFNVESQPVWGPVGYDHVEYYYLPDIDVYYSVPLHRYYYFERGRWIGRSVLPPRYRNFDFYHSYKVVVNEPRPYLHHNIYRDKYSSFRGRHDQQVIRDSREERYFINKNHPEHNNWVKQHKQDSGHSKENGRNTKPERNNRRDKRDQR